MIDRKRFLPFILIAFLFLVACQAAQPAAPTNENRPALTSTSPVTLQTAAAATLPAPTATARPASPTPTVRPPTPTPPAPSPVPPSPLPPETTALDQLCPLDPAMVSSDTKTPGAPVVVAFIAENGIQLWDEASNNSELLFEASDVTSLAFSDDRDLIAFTRQNEQFQTSVWILDVRDRSARELLSAADLLALNLSEAKDLAVDPYRLAWMPGTHRLAFSTRTLSAGDAPPDVYQEMRVIDADSGEVIELLDHNQGGTFTFSPDGAFFALATDTSISLFTADGELVTRDIVTYPALGLSDFYYHPPVNWSADSQSFTFAVLNTSDGLEVAYNPDVTATIWRVSPDDSAVELGTMTGMTLDHAFSPDLARVAFMRPSPKGPPLRELHIADVNNEWDVVYREGENLSFGQWNPDAESLQFVFYDGWGDPGIGRLCHAALPLPTISGPGSTRLVNWVDAVRYLYAEHPSGDLYLGSLDGSQQLIGRMDPQRVSGRTGPLKNYDFFRPAPTGTD